MKHIYFWLLLATIIVTANTRGQIKLLNLSAQPALAQDLRDHQRQLTPIKLSPEDTKKYEADFCGEYVAITLYNGVVGIMCHLDSVGHKSGGWLNLRYTDVEVWLDETKDIPTIQLVPAAGTNRDNLVIRMTKEIYQKVSKCLPGPTPTRRK